MLDNGDAGWHPHIGQASRFGGHTGVDLGRRRDARLSLLEAKVLVVSQRRA